VFLGRDHNGKVRRKSSIFRRTASFRRNGTRPPPHGVGQGARGHSPSDIIWAVDDFNMAIEAWNRNGWQDLSPPTTRRCRSIRTTHIKGSMGRRKIASLSPFDYLRQLEKR
jgi:hypothetical protein